MSSYIFLDFDKQDALNVEKVKNELEGADEKIKALDASTQQCIGIKNELDTLNQNSITTKDQLIQNNTLAETNNNNLIKNNELAQTNIQTLIQQNANITELEKTLDTKITNGNQVSQDLEAKSENANNINLELEKNISNGNQLNTNLTTSVDNANKVMTDTTLNLIDSKNKMLQDSIKQAEDFSKTLKNGTDFVQMRKDIDTLENNLKDTQSLAYSGSDITCNNSLEGRTTGLKLYGKTLYKRKDGTYTDTWEEGCTLESCGEAEGNKISILSTGKNLFNKNQKTENIPNFGDNVHSVKVKENTNYVYTSNPYIGFITVKFYNKDLIEIGNTSINSGSIIKTPIGTVILKLHTDKNSNVQIEEGTQATEFEPYKEYKKEIQLQQPFAGLESVQDTIEETEKGVIYTKNIGKRAYQTGDENLPNVMTDKVNTYYALDKPIKTILKGIEETDVGTFNIITYVKSLNTIPATIDFNVVTNYGSLLMQHSQEINKIWDTINNILVPTIAEVAERSVKTSMNLLSLK